MAMRLTNFGERFILDRIKSYDQYDIGLYVSTDSQDDDSELADLEEIDAGVSTWYGRGQLESFAAANTTAGVTTTTHTVLSQWTHNGVGGAVDVIGYIIFKADEDDVIGFFEFDDPITLENSGDRLQFNVVWGLKDVLD